MANAYVDFKDKINDIIINKKLSPWVHNKTIQKICESFRISNEDKAYLKTLKIKKIVGAYASTFYFIIY